MRLCVLLTQCFEKVGLGTDVRHTSKYFSFLGALVGTITSKHFLDFNLDSTRNASRFSSRFRLDQCSYTVRTVVADLSSIVSAITVPPLTRGLTHGPVHRHEEEEEEVTMGADLAPLQL